MFHLEASCIFEFPGSCLEDNPQENVRKNMKHFRLVRFSYLFVIVLATLVLGTGTTRAMTTLNCGSWNVASSPNAGLDDVLNGVAPVPGTRQFWAVGRY